MTLPVCRYSTQGVRPFDDIYSEFDRPLKSVIEGSAQAGLVVHAEREDLLRRRGGRRPAAPKPSPR